MRFCINFWQIKTFWDTLSPLQPQLLHHCFYTIKKMPTVRATVTKITLRWNINDSFSFMLYFTQYAVKLRDLPLSVVTVLLHCLPNMFAFNSHMRQNAFRNFKWTLEDSLPCNCYAIKTNSRTICSQVLQPSSAGNWSGHEWTAFFQKFCSRGKSGEICFLPHTTKKTAFFSEGFKFLLPSDTHACV